MHDPSVHRASRQAGRPATGFLLPALLLASCSPDGSSASGVTMRDSAGITIVENSLQALEAAPIWSVDPEPRVEIGMLDGPDPYQFVQIHGAALMGDRIWVLDNGADELRAFGLDGSHLLTVGGSGEGPGEFVYPLSLLPLEPDTLVVWDNRAKRISFFSADGAFLRSVNVLHAFMNPSLVAAFADGSFLFRDMWLMMPSTPGIEEAPMNLLHIAADGSLLDSLGSVSAGQMAKVDPAPGFAQVAFSPFATLAGDRASFRVATGAEPEVRERSPEGRVIRILRWEAGDQEVQQEDVDAFFSSILTASRDENRRRAMRAVLDVTPVADRFPYGDRLLLDRVGRLWIREYRRPRDMGPNRWMVFSPAGAILARIEVPREIDPYDIGEDYLLGRTRGEYDEQYVRLYAIRTGPGET